MPIFRVPFETEVSERESPEIRLPRPPILRWNRRVIGVGIVVALVLLAGLVVWNKLVTADPGLSLSHPLVFRSEPGELDGIRTIENRLGREVEIDFVRAGRLTVILELTNGGERGVELRDLPASPLYGVGIERVSSSSTDHTDPDAERARPTDVPFKPFTLDSGETVDIRWDLRFGDCEPRPGTTISPAQFGDVPVSYHAFGFRRTVDVPFEHALLSLFPSGGCAR